MTIPIRSHHRTAGTLLVLLVASICVFAQSQQFPRTRTTPTYAKVESKTGAINGRVVDETGQPLVNADVYVRSDKPDESQAPRAKTNREGVFKFTLEPGSYTVSAQKPSYIARPPQPGQAVKTSGESVTLVLLKGGVISGTVTNSRNDPIIAIAIRVEMRADESGRQTAAIAYESITDDRGVYRVYGLPAGSYIVSADGGPNYSPTGVNPFAIDTPTYAPSSNREAAEEIKVRIGEETSNVDIRYRGEHGNTISGVVKGTRTGDRGFSVSITSLAEKGPRFDNYFREPNGEFSFEGIPDGDYLVVGTAYWNDRDRGESETTLLNVRGADIEGVELTAATLASISGTVVLKELKEPVAECTDKRLPQFSEVSLGAFHRVTQGAKKKPQFVVRARASGNPNEQGNVLFKDLAANEYYFGLRLPGPPWYLQSIAFVPQTPGGKPTDVTRTWTTVKPGEQLTGLTFTLVQGAALVRGQITLAEGQTLPNKLSVYLVPAEAAQAENALRYFAGPVSSEGYFWLSNVVPGRYWILAQNGIEDTRYELSKIRLPDAAEKRAILRHTAEQQKKELELKPCQELTYKLPL
ncbi:MAG TPA: carboxypeptidase-like regulatory domain-containing protein [Pyrinomonadaceae bacterium]|nr:carboxypeptidase-like regulatory domain-containing protein [Pyrinomonadaceae bacterium]